MNRTVLHLLLLSFLPLSSATPQKQAPGIRAAQQYEVSHPVEPPIVKPPRVNVAELQSQAEEISSLAHSIPGDVGQVAKGVLPKDLVAKLRRLEKLSKSLRSKLAN